MDYGSSTSVYGGSEGSNLTTLRYMALSDSPKRFDLNRFALSDSPK